MNARRCETALARPDRAFDMLLQTLLDPVPEYRPETATEAPAARPPVDGVNQAARRPGWADVDRLRLLRVRFGDHWMALPLSGLRAVLRADPRHAARLPEQPPWHRGVFRARGRSVVRVDPVALLALSGARGGDWLVLLDPGRWALECAALGDTLEIDTGAVRWGPPAGAAGWVAGVLPGGTCLLADPESLVARIEAAGTKSAEPVSAPRRRRKSVGDAEDTPQGDRT